MRFIEASKSQVNKQGRAGEREGRQRQLRHLRKTGGRARNVRAHHDSANILFLNSHNYLLYLQENMCGERMPNKVSLFWRQHC